MPKPPLSVADIKLITDLRKTGHSLPEIKKITKRSNATVLKYISGIKIAPEYLSIWKEKQGGSKRRAENKWNLIRSLAEAEIKLPLSKREKLIVLACLYWGEGNKKDLILTNTDPSLIKTFVSCLKVAGIDKKELRISIRIFEDIDKNKAISYWAKIIGIPTSQITSLNILRGKKEGKLEYGMCRVRVKKGGDHFKFIMSVIALIKLDFAAVVQRIERGTPKP